MSLKNFMFRQRQETRLLHLQGKVEVMLHGGRRSPLDFYCLGKNLEDFRDLIRNHLDGLPIDERAAVEDQLFPPILTLYDLVDRLVEEAHKAGIIDEGMSYDLGMLGISLMFVASFSKHVF